MGVGVVVQVMVRWQQRRLQQQQRGRRVELRDVGADDWMATSSYAAAAADAVVMHVVLLVVMVVVVMMGYVRCGRRQGLLLLKWSSGRRCGRT